MVCTVCDCDLQGSDLVNFLHTDRALVHRACYERHTGHMPAMSHTLADWLLCLATATRAAA